MESVKNYILKLYKNNDEIALLSWFYGAIAVLFVFIAGLCALIDQPFGVGLLIIPLVAIIALCANITVWALIKLFIQHLDEHKPEKEEEKKEEKTKSVKVSKGEK